MSGASFPKDHPGQAPVLLVGLRAGRVPGLPSRVSLHLCLPCPGSQTLMDTVSGWTGWFLTFLRVLFTSFLLQFSSSLFFFTLLFTCDFDSVVFIYPRDALTGYWFYRLSRYEVIVRLIVSSSLRLPSNISEKRLCSDCFWRTQMLSGRDWAESAGQERVGSLTCIRYWTDTEFQISNAHYLWIL